MSEYYITSYADSWLYRIYCAMSDRDFANELVALKSARALYLKGNDDLAYSPVFEYLDDVWEVVRDSLVTRFLNSQGLM